MNLQYQNLHLNCTNNRKVKVHSEWLTLNRATKVRVYQALIALFRSMYPNEHDSVLTVDLFSIIVATYNVDLFFFFGKSNFIVSLIFLLKFVINFYLVEAVDLTNRLPIHSLVHLDYCYHCRISFVVGAPINAQLANM